MQTLSWPWRARSLWHRAAPSSRDVAGRCRTRRSGTTAPAPSERCARTFARPWSCSASGTPGFAFVVVFLFRRCVKGPRGTVKVHWHSRSHPNNRSTRGATATSVRRKRYGIAATFSSSTDRPSGGAPGSRRARDDQLLHLGLIEKMAILRFCVFLSARWSWVSREGPSGRLRDLYRPLPCSSCSQSALREL